MATFIITGLLAIGTAATIILFFSSDKRELWEDVVPVTTILVLVMGIAVFIVLKLSI